MTSVTLPWPPKQLAANSRKDRRYTGQFRRDYKHTCWTLGKESKFRSTHLDITFHPPCGRRRDLDNMLSGIKYGLDGLALAMGIDDSDWTMTIRKGPPSRPHGAVVITGGQE